MPAVTGIKDATAIVGIGQTSFAKHLPEDERTLACRAVLAALDDAGIAPGEVDALASYTLAGDRPADQGCLRRTPRSATAPAMHGPPAPPSNGRVAGAPSGRPGGVWPLR